METEKNLLHISKKAFINVLVILSLLIIMSGILTRIIPAGSYQRDQDGMIIDHTYKVIESFNYPIYRWFLAPFEVFLTNDIIPMLMIGIFLMILGGTFSIMDKTGGIHVLIKRLILRFKDNKYLLLRLIILIFMSFGAFFGIFEEAIALMPILILVALSFGWDTMTGMAMSLLAVGFGFATAITNPFSIGIASNLAGINILSGALYRLFIFAVMYIVLSTFIVKYAKKIEKNPQKSLSYDIDQKKVKSFDMHQVLQYKNEKTIYKTYLIFFVVLFIGIILISLLELIFHISIPAILFMSIIFLLGGITAGLIVTKNVAFTFKTFLSGMISVAPALILIVLAVSVKHIITSAQIMDSILYFLANTLKDHSAMVGILWIYAIVLLLQFFIGSASAKAFLIMPLLLPLVTLIGISKELAILAFVFGDGYTNVIFPTNGVLLIGLSIAGISYNKWFKFTYKLQILTLILSVIFLLIAVVIGY